MPLSRNWPTINIGQTGIVKGFLGVFGGSALSSRLADRRTVPRILIIGPAPGQAGGISSVMAYLETELTPEKFDVIFLDTLRRGRWSITQFLVTLVRSIGHIAASRIARQPIAVHLNVSTRGSTYRKWLISRVCVMSGTPYMVHLHGSKYRKFFDGASALVQWVVLSLFRDAASVVVLGNAWRNYVVQELKVRMDRVAVVPNGTPEPPSVDRSRADTRGIVRIVFSGRLSIEKGLADLVRATDLLYEERQDFELVLMGDSRDASLLASVKSRGYCVVTGWVANEQVVQQLVDADIFILPSHDEGLPMSMIEAMSLGLPVIVTDVGAISDVVLDGQEGYLVDAGDIEGLRSSLRSLVSDKGLREDMGRCAHRRWRSELQASQMTRGIESRWHDLLTLCG